MFEQSDDIRRQRRATSFGALEVITHGFSILILMQTGSAHAQAQGLSGSGVLLHPKSVEARASITEPGNLTGTWSGINTNPGDPISTQWDEEFDLQQDNKGNVGGTRKSVAEAAPNHFVVWSISGTYQGGVFQYVDQTKIREGVTPPNYCMDQGQLTASGTNLMGTWQAAGCAGGTTNVSFQRAPAIKLYRQDLNNVIASATPLAGSFALQTTSLSGPNYPTAVIAAGQVGTDNPLIISLPDPQNAVGGAIPGGLAKVVVTFTPQGQPPVSASFDAPSFGMSCYDTALESDFGSPPQCAALAGVSATGGTVTNPPNITGTFCRSFINQVIFQGSGVLNNGQAVQSNKGIIKYVSQISGSDGSPVIANQTVARDKAQLSCRPPKTFQRIIPATDVYLDVHGVGTNLLANDKGCDIVGYRLDLYKGAGSAVCSGYTNPIAVSSCSPTQPKCPGSAIQ